jgi:hypothetical protein
VPLIPHFDKPAFSRIPKNCEPQIVVEMFEEFVKRRVCQNGGGVAHGWDEWHTADGDCIKMMIKLPKQCGHFRELVNI